MKRLIYYIEKQLNKTKIYRQFETTMHIWYVKNIRYRIIRFISLTKYAQYKLSNTDTSIMTRVIKVGGRPEFVISVTPINQIKTK